EKCDGLPVAISTLGSALRRKTKAVWNDALRLLQKPFGGDIQGMKKNVYQSIRLSYDFLEREEAKSCFLLCCIFRESTII
ncbi:NB-ARC domain-containing protein, partial [Mycobacterium kansasii]